LLKRTALVAGALTAIVLTTGLFMRTAEQLSSVVIELREKRRERGDRIREEKRVGRCTREETREGR